VKNLYDTTYANKIENCSENIAYYTFFLNVLDKQKESICLKFLSLLKEITKINVRYKKATYKFVIKTSKCKSKAMTLERYILLYYLKNEYDLLADLQNT